MENIGFFLSACESFGLTKQDLFQTVDLYEGENVPVVSYPLGISMAMVNTLSHYYNVGHQWSSCIRP